MPGDRVSELYYGRIMQPETQEACRERIHWMCSQVAGTDVLDLGCSQGIASLLLGREGHKVLGLDIDAEAIDYARRQLADQPASVQENTTFKHIEPGAVPCEDESFDTVLLGEILEHQACPAKMLAEVRRVLRPGGKVVITVPFGVHPQPDHLQTFYLNDLLKLLENEFQVGELFVAHKYIHCTAIKKGVGVEKVPPSKQAAEVLAASEQAFLEAEKYHWKTRDRQKERINQLQERVERQKLLLAESETNLLKVMDAYLYCERDGVQLLDRLLAWQRQYPERSDIARAINELRRVQDRLRLADNLKEKLSIFKSVLQVCYKAESCCVDLHKESARQEKERLEGEIRGLKSRVSRQSEQIDYYKAECERKFEEIRYLLGDAFVRAFSSPRDFVLLPVRLLRLFLAGLHRRRERRRSDRYEQQQSAQKAIAKPENKKDSNPTIKIQRPEIVEGVFGAADGVELYPARRPQRQPRTNIKAAVIFDEFTAECFRDEFHMIHVTPDNWREVISAERPDFLFVESAWKGYGMAWRHMISRARQMNGGPLVPLVEWCKQQGIPTVFWNKEDPPNFEHFIYAASHFDYIFTTDEDCIPDYREYVGHDRIMALPFAAQPTIHNPVGTTVERAGKVCFAGTWYNRKHSERRVDMEMLLNPALSRGLHIYDRMYHHQVDDAYRWPEKYQPAIQGSLPYEYTIDAYKKYQVFLNVNSVKYSPTMFSRRVLELLACGTPVISTYSLGIEKMLGREAVALVESEQEVADWLDRLLGDAELRERMVHLGQRRIFSEHTYAHRFATIAEQLGLEGVRPEFATSVIAWATEPAQLKRLVEYYGRQSWPERELICVYNGSAGLPSEIENQIGQGADVRLLRVAEQESLVEGINRALHEARHAYLAFFDPGSFYGEHYLRDLLSAFIYADADVVGKAARFSYHSESRSLALQNEELQRRYVDVLPLSAMIARREVFDKLTVQDEDIKDALHFSRRCKDNGLKLYSADRFNYADLIGQSPVFCISEADEQNQCLLTHADEYQSWITI